MIFPEEEVVLPLTVCAFLLDAEIPQMHTYTESMHTHPRRCKYKAEAISSTVCPEMFLYPDINLL